MREGTNKSFLCYATLHHIIGDLLHRDEAGLSEAAWRALDARDGSEIAIEHPSTLESLHKS